MNKYTKITASIGPKCEGRETLTRMISAGVNMCRLNFSHDTGDVQGRKIDMIRDVSAELNTPVAVMIDLQGPKHRIGNFATEDKYPLTIGQKFTFDTNPALGDTTRVQLPDTDVLGSLQVGDRILLNDGKIEMRVDFASPERVDAT
ncbi:MAG: pyruvate kinase, partial [Alphaproteobacteria bacterium]|nr:pyruvate kinase [Alphaproteobacteria bacterium]